MHYLRRTGVRSVSIPSLLPKPSGPEERSTLYVERMTVRSGTYISRSKTKYLEVFEITKNGQLCTFNSRRMDELLCE